MNRAPILLACLAMFGMMTGQQMINPILAPLARDLGLSELHLGLVMTVGAAGVVVVSTFWGRRSATWGHKPVLLTSLFGVTAALVAFAFTAQIGLTGALTVPLVFGLILVTRGLMFGLAYAALP